MVVSVSESSPIDSWRELWVGLALGSERFEWWLSGYRGVDEVLAESA